MYLEDDMYANEDSKELLVRKRHTKMDHEELGEINCRNQKLRLLLGTKIELVRSAGVQQGSADPARQQPEKSREGQAGSAGPPMLVDH